MSEAVLEVEALTVRFGHGRLKVTAVDGVCLHLRRGEALGLVGESGSGKSTILRAITGLTTIAGGQIRLDGAALAPPRGLAVLRRVQMVFQDPYASLHPRHTVDRILSEPLAIHRLPDRERRILAVLREVGLGPAYRFRYPHQLSGGQRQRVAIARALILEPEILLLDEPTSALDASVQAEILNLLEALRRERGLTFLLVSHNLAVVAHLCERLIVMRGGRIEEETTAAALRSGTVAADYTRRMLTASEGFVRRGAAPG
ncbi:ABC transporter ATP-binding protein [Labrys wisconsinensis]|uniref:Peptide/nickel transport system ATP-binding protein n=1 Tax=Labrys wisconsinensis TaxID=425677 RepID=A0ABU0J7K4_9HYPH|nr:ABC transporter ATP-binding protein [Labrys wisconsinensis]MDQ0470245.1 peptide/nickel transport system ATP-binding protein [Labrys wisconsinensis]